MVNLAHIVNSHLVHLVPTHRTHHPKYRTSRNKNIVHIVIEPRSEIVLYKRNEKFRRVINHTLFQP